MFIGIAINITGRLLSSASPASLFANGEIGAWYDPSDITTLFQDNAGTTPVTAVGQSVGKMLDKSGRGNHATQATSTQRPTYQIDSAGHPYLLFDGVDDGMVTGTITPATNKVQVFAGVRKLSDAARGLVVELSVDTDLNAGSFALTAPNGAGLSNFAAYAGGSVRAAGGYPTGNTAPVTRVISFTSDIPADVLSRRQNATDVGTITTDQGTGNYLAYPLYIGRHGGSTLPFNGRLYSLIVRFGPNLTTGQITSTESWVNSKTGAY